MLKLVFSLGLKNSNFKNGENLPLFDTDESFYSEFWSDYLFCNFLNIDRSQKVQTYLPQRGWKLEMLDLSSTIVMEIKNLVGSYSDKQGFCSYFRTVE